jgi:FAD/FMN-containing dehydrogenase
VPLDAPGWLLAPPLMKAFNQAYYHKSLKPQTRGDVHFDPFFFPLDRVPSWNRLYGRSGFLQHQCVVPFSGGDSSIREILDRIARSGMASFLAVLKTFGDVESPGLMSFPRPGVTLALDFPFRGRKTLDLLSELDGVVRAAGGALYPAKDARMSAETFRESYPKLAEFRKSIDPKFSSSLWRRVNA